MSIETINENFLEFLKNVLTEVYQDKKTLSKDAIITNLSKILDKKEKKIKAKTSTPKKELAPEDKCIAKKKDGDRCGGKNSANYEVPELCVLHNRSPPKYGYYDDVEESEAEAEAEVKVKVEKPKKAKSKSTSVASKLSKKPKSTAVTLDDVPEPDLDSSEPELDEPISKSVIDDEFEEAEEVDFE